MARAWLRRLSENRAVARAVGLVERLDSSRRCWLRVLTYHRVDQGEPFARQMEHLAARYRVVSVPALLSALDGGEPLPPRAVLLTFDDAHRSFAEVAWPILCRHEFSAAVFVPTAYPDSDETRFWWDRLEQAFAVSARRDELATSMGRLLLASAEQRTAAHQAVKRHVKELGPREARAVVEEICTALEVEPVRHEVLGWAELRGLALAGVQLGAHTRSHPRLDRLSLAEAGEEIMGSLRDLEREVPGLPRLFAYPDGRFSNELVELVRAAGVELAFTTRSGAYHLGAHDRLRLRRINIDSRDSREVFRAKLALGSPLWSWVRRLSDPPSSAERAAERAHGRERRRVRYLFRPLDAALCGLQPGGPLGSAPARSAGRRVSNYERLVQLVRLTTSCTPRLARRLERLLQDGTRLPFDALQLELVGRGSGATVFRLELAGHVTLALKVYRRSLGRRAEILAQRARHYRARHELLRAWYGDLVLPAGFLVLQGPLLAQPSVACVQEFLPGTLRDPLALGDAELGAWLGRDSNLSCQFVDFARRTLAWRARGRMPDLIGRGNLLVVQREDGARLQLVDNGVFDLRATPVRTRCALDVVTSRFESLLEKIEHHEVLLQH